MNRRPKLPPLAHRSTTSDERGGFGRVNDRNPTLDLWPLTPPPACFEPTTLSGGIALELWRLAASDSTMVALTVEHRRALISWCRAALQGDADALTACRLYARVVVAWEDALVILRSTPGGMSQTHDPHDTAGLRRLFREAGHVLVGVELEETHDDYVAAWLARVQGEVTAQALGELATLDFQGGCRMRGWVL